MKLQIKRKPFGVTLLALPDIAFLLLIFLILTVSVDDQGEIKLPDFKFLQETEFPETIVLTISKNGEYHIAGQIIEKTDLDSILRTIPKTTIIHLMEQLQEKNLRDVVLIMENNNQKDNE